MTAAVSLLETHEWLGEFWLPGSEDQKFPAIVRYSPRDGLLLTTSETGRLPDNWEEECKTIHGVTHATGPLTLLKAWPRSSGTYKTWSLEREFYSGAAIWGRHFDEESRFRSLAF